MMRPVSEYAPSKGATPGAVTPNLYLETTMSTAKKLVHASPDALGLVKAEIEAVPGPELQSAVSNLVEASECDSFRLGGFLYRVREEGVFGDGTFSEWLLSRGIAKSTAYGLIDVYEAIVTAQLPPDTLTRVGGWSKLRVVAPMLQPGKSAAKHNEKWIAKEEKSNRLDLQAAVKAAKAVPALEIVSGKPDSSNLAEGESDVEANRVDDANGNVSELVAFIHTYLPEEVLEAFAIVWPDIDVKAVF